MRVSKEHKLLQSRVIATHSILQRNIANAQNQRTLAYAIMGVINPQGQTTAAVSNNLFAITPAIPADNAFIFAHCASGQKLYAPAVPNGNMAGNHAERKLLFHDHYTQEIGVSRAICQACINHIIANPGNLQHVSDPNGTYAVPAFNWVAP